MFCSNFVDSKTYKPDLLQDVLCISFDERKRGSVFETLSWGPLTESAILLEDAAMLPTPPSPPKKSMELAQVSEAKHLQS